MEPLAPEWRTFGAPETGGDARPAPTSAVRRLELRPTGSLLLIVVTALGLAACALAVIAVAAWSSPPGAGVGFENGQAGGFGGLELTGPDGDGADEVAVPPGASVVLVDVEGAVGRPGIVRLGQGSRVGDAIAAAGGFAPRADLAAAAERLNLAEPVTDGAKVLVPALGEGPRSVAGPAGRASSAPFGAAVLVDLNRASAAELEALPGIGAVTASRIIESRADAPFRAVDDLRTRELVGAATFGKVRALVTVGG